MSAGVGEIEKLQNQLGARFDRQEGPVRVLDYGNAKREERALRDGVAIIWRSWRGGLRVTGQERAPFLHRLLSGRVTGLAAGTGGHALLLDQRGKVIADLDLWIDEDQILLLADTRVLSTVATILQHYILRSAVSIEAIDDSTVLAIGGPGVVEVLARAEVEPPTQGGLIVSRFGGSEVRVLQRSRDPWSFEMLVQAADAVSLWRALAGAGDVVPAGWTASEVLRVESGIPAQGAELTGSELPQEVRLDGAIDFDKGCYLGQETVARIHYRGHVNRLLCGLRMDEAVTPGDRLICADRPTGQVTSAVVSTLLGPVGLAYVRTDDSETGTVMRTEAGIKARTVSLPMHGAG